MDSLMFVLIFGLVITAIAVTIVKDVIYYFKRPHKKYTKQSNPTPRVNAETIPCAACDKPTTKKSSMVDLMHSHGYSQFLCPACYNKASGRAWMPKLHGRPQQIKWANLIRLNALAANPQNRLLHTQKDAAAWIDYHESLSKLT